METGDEIQLRGAISDASKADVPVEEVEEAQKFLQRLTLRRRVDFLEKAIGSRDEGQLREAIAAARKVSLPEAKRLGGSTGQFYPRPLGPNYSGFRRLCGSLPQTNLACRVRV